MSLSLLPWIKKPIKHLKKCNANTKRSSRRRNSSTCNIRKKSRRTPSFWPLLISWRQTLTRSTRTLILPQMSTNPNNTDHNNPINQSRATSRYMRRNPRIWANPLFIARIWASYTPSRVPNKNKKCPNQDSNGAHQKVEGDKTVEFDHIKGTWALIP